MYQFPLEGKFSKIKIIRGFKNIIEERSIIFLVDSIKCLKDCLVAIISFGASGEIYIENKLLVSSDSQILISILFNELRIMS